MSDLIVFDSSVFIDNLRSGLHQQKIESIQGLVRTSSVVLAELWRGATRPSEQHFLRTLAANHPILTPTENNWLESGEILCKIRGAQKLRRDMIRNLHFDVLIALSARSHGALVITSDRTDFELIRRYRNFRLEIW